MRAFRYFYSSYMENAHGFFTFWPYAQVLHPYFGLYTIGVGPYRQMLERFKSHRLSFKHKVKIFFPEIVEGYVFIDKIKYHIESSDKRDNVNLKIKEIIKDSPYLDYVLIKNHIAEFSVELELETDYVGIFGTIEIICDYIDFIVGTQRGSITLTTNNVKIIPYLHSYRMNLPLYYLETGSDYVMHMTNTDLKNILVFPNQKDVRDMLERHKVDIVEGFAIFDVADYQFKTPDVLIANFHAYELNFADERENIDNLNIIPLLSSGYGMSAKEICDNGLCSYWYITVYDQNYSRCNYTCPPFGWDPQICGADYSADETRGYFWYKIHKEYSNSEKSLDIKMKDVFGADYKVFYRLLVSYYKRDKK